MNSSNNIARIIAVVAIILIGGGAIAYSVLGKKPSTTAVAISTATTATPVTTNTPQTSPATQPSAPTSEFKDGTYTAVGSYISPGGDEKIQVTLTLQNDVITAASVVPEPVSPEGHQFQGIFAANFQPLVVGKDITSVHLTKVSGSSLTSGGFNDALAQIEAQAKA